MHHNSEFSTWWPTMQEACPRLASETARSRVQRLRQLRDTVLQHEEAVKEALKSDLGKPHLEGTLTELLPVYNELKHFIHKTPSWMRPSSVGPHFPYLLSRGYLQYQPKGCVLVIAPWNYPFQLAVLPLIAALAAGNTVVVKPSEFAPATALVLERILTQAFGPELVRVVRGDAAVGAALLELPFDHVLFTGGERVGKLVAESTAKRLIPCTLELGGKSPVYVDESAPLESTAAKIYWGKWLNGGQTCIAPDYVLVNQSMLPVFAEALRKAAALQNRNQESSLSCQVHAAHAQRMRALLQEAVEQGAKIEVGGTWKEEGLCLEPTVLSGVHEGMRLMQEEIFGPILPLVGVRHLEDALQYVTKRPKPLALYVFARNQEVVRRWSLQSSSGSLCLNDVVVQISHPRLPLGGVGASGSGSYHGKFGFETFSHTRAVLVNPHRPNLTSLFYPPYTPLKNRLAGILTRLMR